MRLKNRHIVLSVISVIICLIYRISLTDKNTVNKVVIHPQNQLIVHYSSYCNCTRQFTGQSSDGREHWCSEEASMRGSGQNIITYSLYGNAVKNKRLTTYYLVLNSIPREVGQFYPEWFIRVYHNITREQSIEHKMLCNVYCNNPKVDLCDANELIKQFRKKRRIEIVPITETLLSRMNPRLWRYLPMMDSLVDRIMSRDIDAEIIEREATAVKQWLLSNYTFHIIRDHHFHCYPSADNFQPILAGLFGVKIFKKRELVDALTRVMTTIGDEQEYYVDQYLLARVFWPIAKDDAVIHDSHCCKNNWNSLPSWSYPTQRVNGTFISDRRGSSWARPKPCPIECRPPDHRDWEYC